MTLSSEIISPAEDPYTALCREVWHALEEDPDFLRLVPESNRIKFLGPARDPEKVQIAESDLPEARLEATSSAPHPQGASNLITDAVTLTLYVTTGDKRLSHLHWPLKWIVFRVFSRMRLRWNQVASRPQWNGHDFIYNVSVDSETDAPVTPEDERGIKGWQAVWSITISLQFTRADIAAQGE